jgi:hypothetical protein
MIEITIPAMEMWDPQKEEFISKSKEVTLQLEHSLISLSKWEAKWQKPFLNGGLSTYEETIDYIRCMTISKVTDPSVYYRIPTSEINKVNDYIQNPMTATWFSEDKNPVKKPGRKEIITAEILYYDMIALGIPFECQKWHLNRLITLIRVCQKKQEKPEKQSKRQIMASNKALNAQRRAAMHSKG